MRKMLLTFLAFQFQSMDCGYAEELSCEKSYPLMYSFLHLSRPRGSVSWHSCVADRLPVVVRFPAGPRVRLNTVDPPKGNGLGTKKMLVKETLEYVGWGEAITLWSKRVCQWEERRCLRQLAVGQFPSVGWCCTRWRFFLQTCWLLWTLVMPFYRWTSSANQGREYVILKNLPGQRLGARSWCWYFRNYLEEKFKYEFCDVQPCLSRTRDSVILIHGWHPLHWQNSLRSSFYQFVKSVSLLNGVHCKSLAAQSRSWRRRSLWLHSRWPHGSSWYTSSQGGWSFWKPFWLIPCDASQSNLRTYQLNWLQQFSEVVGMCFYLSWDRPDITFPVKEVSGKMSRPVSVNDRSD